MALESILGGRRFLSVLEDAQNGQAWPLVLDVGWISLEQSGLAPLSSPKAHL